MEKFGVWSNQKKNFFNNVFGSDFFDNQVTTLPIAHKIDCTGLYNDGNKDSIAYFESFPSRDVKYDKEYKVSSHKFEYDHVCNTCYDCIISHDYISNGASDDVLKKAEAIAIAKIRNNTYKMTGFIENIGRKYETKRVDEFEIKTKECYQVNITVKLNSTSLGGTRNLILRSSHTGNVMSHDDPSISLINTEPQTLTYNVFEEGKCKLYLKGPGLVEANDLQIISVEYKYK